MAGPVATLGDLAPAPILAPCHANILCNGRPSAMPGSLVTPHGKPPHTSPVLLPAMTTTTFFNGQMARRISDLVSCGHVISTGQINIIISP